MSMPETLHIEQDELIQYAMGTLKEAQLTTLTAHISMCNTCRGELGKIHLDLACYATVMPQEQLPEGAQGRFMERLTSGSAVESKFVQMRNKSRLYVISKSVHNWLGTPMPLKILCGALAAAVLLLGYDDLSHIHENRQLMPEMKRFEKETVELQELREFLQGSHLQTVTLRERPLQSKTPEGHALYSAVQGKLVFLASNMAAPPAGKAYELWVLPAGGGAPIAAGTFVPDHDGSGSIIFPSIPGNVPAAGFGITLEDAKGSPTPTSPILLSGQ